MLVIMAQRGLEVAALRSYGVVMSGRVVIVGGGLAAGTVATQLREGGHDGSITVFTDEPRPPYERPPLSKDLLLGKGTEEKALVQQPEWYAENDVELHTDTAVTSLDVAAREVVAGADRTPYDHLVLATGSRPRHLRLADESGAPVVYLRTMEDSRRIKAALVAGTRIGIVGGGWIGLEVASAARNADAEVTLVESLEQPLLRVLGPEVATIFAELHREHGVDLRLGASLTGISRDGERGVLEIADSEPVPCDLIVVGIGIEPVTELATAAGLTVDNGIRTDDRLRTSSRDVYAAGDVANADHPVLGRPVRVEHWDTAIQHGKVVARNILGEETKADALPYFFTDQYDLGMEYVGSPGPDGYDSVVLRGDTEGRVFTAWWLRGELVVAGMHANDWDAIADVRRIVGAHVDVDALRDESRALGDV
jgi:3-phenylpropionate/trans-cinnamate dioxygenase ferredoxin reductase subunit